MTAKCASRSPSPPLVQFVPVVHILADILVPAKVPTGGSLVKTGHRGVQVLCRFSSALIHAISPARATRMPFSATESDFT